MTNEWHKFPDVEPPSGESVLVLRKYLDAPYGEHGYDDSKAFWTKAYPDVDIYWANKQWHSRSGKVTHWMKIPELPND